MASPRTLRILSDGQVVSVTVRGSRQARAIGRYWFAVYEALSTGDEEPLRKFQGVRVRSHYLETHLDVIKSLDLNAPPLTGGSE